MIGDMPVDFFSSHSVFRVEELEKFYRDTGRPVSGIKPLLGYHVTEGNLLSVRRGVYRQPTASACAIASRLTDDAVLSHEGALAFYELADDLSITFSTTHRFGSFGDSSSFFRAVRVSPLELHAGAEKVAIDDLPGLVTSLEKTFVDCLTRPAYSPEPEELRDALREASTRLDLEALVRFALDTDSPLVVSRVGFFLQYSVRNVDHHLLARLEKKMLPKPDYFRRTERTKGDSIVPRWRLIVPDAWHSWRP